MKFGKSLFLFKILILVFTVLITSTIVLATNHSCYEDCADKVPVCRGVANCDYTSIGLWCVPGENLANDPRCDGHCINGECVDCVPGEVEEPIACGSNIGECKEGERTRVCQSNGQWGAWSSCGGPDYVGPGAEVCDGSDNDCDGSTDEGDVCGGGTTAAYSVTVSRSDNPCFPNYVLDCTGVFKIQVSSSDPSANLGNIPIYITRKKMPLGEQFYEEKNWKIGETNSDGYFEKVEVNSIDKCEGFAGTYIEEHVIITAPNGLNYASNHIPLWTASCETGEDCGNNAPTGELESVDGSQIIGWAKDADTAQNPFTGLGPIKVHLYIDDEYVGQYLADDYRAGIGYHGFNIPMPQLPAGQHNIKVYAIDEVPGGCSGQGSNKFLGSKTLVITDTQYTVTLTRENSCGSPDNILYVPGCTGTITAQINPPDAGVALYIWRMKKDPEEQFHIEQYGGALFGVTDSNGRYTYTETLTEANCPHFEGDYINEYVRVGNRNGPKSNVNAFIANCLDLECTPGEVGTESCGTNVGECVLGEKTRTCQNNREWGPWSACNGNFIGPSTEICDGKDNDCDGDTDEGCNGYTVTVSRTDSCFPDYVPGCEGRYVIQVNPKAANIPIFSWRMKNGVEQFSGTQVGVTNSQGRLVLTQDYTQQNCAQFEGAYTNEFVRIIAVDGPMSNSLNFMATCPLPPVCSQGQQETRDCGTDEGECVSGTQTRICQSNGQWGSWSACNGNFIGPSQEVCDGLDNDCDTETDEGDVCFDCTPGDTQSCGTDDGECVAGTQTCGTDGQWGQCVGGIGPTAEVCNGLDDDCDGSIDEGGVCPPVCTPGDTQSCGSDEGECTSGTQVCQSDGQWGPCNDIGPTTEVCDGLDNDCDTQVDEGFTYDQCFYVCEDFGYIWTNNGGSLNCCGDDPFEDNPYENPEVTCNDGNDNDCDGFIDFDDPDCIDVPVTVNIIADPMSGEVPFYVYFRASVTGNAPFSYAWDFNNDGIVDSTSPSPRVEYRVEGNYLVTLTVRDFNGDVGFDSVLINAKKHRVNTPRKKILINQIAFQADQIRAGEDLIIYLHFTNQGNYDMNDASATIIVPELNMRLRQGHIDLDTDEGATKKFILETPADAQPGVYDSKIIIYEDGLKRVRYRPFEIVG